MRCIQSINVHSVPKRKCLPVSPFCPGGPTRVGWLSGMSRESPWPVFPVDELSPAAKSVWAKSDRDADGWLPLWRHLADSGATAALLWDEWIPGQAKKIIAEALPRGLDDARRACVW